MKRARINNIVDFSAFKQLYYTVFFARGVNIFNIDAEQRNCVSGVLGCIEVDFKIVKLLCKRNLVLNSVAVNAQKHSDILFGGRQLNIKSRRSKSLIKSLGGSFAYSENLAR